MSTTDSKLYPDLPQIDALGSIQNPMNFRLKQISDVKVFFEEEIEYRRKLYSKYKKAFSAITGVSHFLNFTSIAAGSVGVSALAGVVTAPIGIALGSVTIATSLISTGLNIEKKKILKKLSKHEKIHTLAISKLNTINDLVSKALTDSLITSEEFTLINKEKEKYIGLKNTVRKDHRTVSNVDVDAETLKKTFLEEGKKLAQIMEKLK